MKETFLQDSEFEALTTSELVELLKQPLILEKGRALFELARRSSEDNDLLGMVVKEVHSSKNKSTRTVGIVSISFLGIAGLLYSDSNYSKNTATELIDSWKEPDRSNLVEFLDSLSPQPTGATQLKV